MKRIIALALCLCLACSVAFAEYLYDQPNQLIGIRAGWTWSSYKQAGTETKSQAIDAGVDFVRYLTSSGNLGVSAGIGLEALQHSSGTPVAYRGNIGLAYRRFLSSDSWFSCTAGDLSSFLTSSGCTVPWPTPVSSSRPTKTSVCARVVRSVLSWAARHRCKASRPRRI